MSAAPAVAPAVGAPATPLAIPAKAYGAPPTGIIPILYNDEHIYTKPDKIRQSRVLAALIRGKTILVPLRSMFEQMGGVVTYASDTKTVEVSKPGVDVQVTVGKRSVIINGETRPLDVPPEIYKGDVVVPVRVISEALGAYVLWVSDKRLVVVRYLMPAMPSPTPIPTPPPTPPPTPVPTAVPSPVPTPTVKPGEKAEAFIVADGDFDPKVYDAFSPGNKGGESLSGRVGLTFPINNVGFLAEATVAIFRYPHDAKADFNANLPCGVAGQPNAGDPSCVSVLGPPSGSAYVPSFEARDTDVDARLGIRLAKTFYLVAAYDTRYENFGYPRTTGFGGGIEKTANLKQSVDIYGSILYFPELIGDYVDLYGNGQQLKYSYLKYQAGLTLSSAHFPLFLDLGFLGNHELEKQNAPDSTSEIEYYAGLGIHL